MKTTSLKTIYLEEHELKQAIVEYLEKEHEELAQHLRNNECEMVWGQDGKEFLVSIDGEIDDGGNTPERVEEQIEWLKKVAEQKEINKMVDQVESAAVKAAHKVMEQHSEAFEKLAEKRVTDEIKELKKQVEELKKENAELQRELSVHNFLDTGVPQERLDYQRELKKEIIRLKSLNRRAADEIRDLDNIIIDFVEGNAFPHKNEDDLWAGESSINLLNRLDGRTKGGYVENYEDLLSEMKAIDGE